MSQRLAAVTAFHWTDGRGLAWRVEVWPGGMVLDNGERRESIPADEWAERVSLEPLGGSYVLRLDLSDRQVGFLLPAREVHEFARSSGVTSPTTPQSAETVTPGGLDSPVDAPRIQARTVWALVLSCAAFVPLVGLPVAAIAAAMAGWALVVSRRKAWLSHNRRMAWVAMAVATWSVALNVAATASWLRQPPQRLTVLPDMAVHGPGKGWDWPAVVSSILVILLALSVHEAAHAVSAWWCGDQTARWLGRVSLNPLRHVDPVGTILLPAILIYMGSPAFGWARPVPVDRSRLRNRRKGDMFVSFAGPLSNLLQAGLFLSGLLAVAVCLRLIDPPATVRNVSNILERADIRGFVGAGLLTTLVTFLKTGFLVNLFLAAFNLIPIPPLDGSWVLGSLFPRTIGRLMNHIRPYGFLVVLGLLYTNVLDELMWPAEKAVQFGELLVYLCTSL